MTESNESLLSSSFILCPLYLPSSHIPFCPEQSAFAFCHQIWWMDRTFLTEATSVLGLFMFLCQPSVCLSWEHVVGLRSLPKSTTGPSLAVLLISFIVSLYLPSGEFFLYPFLEHFRFSSPLPISLLLHNKNWSVCWCSTSISAFSLLLHSPESLLDKQEGIPGAQPSSRLHSSTPLLSFSQGWRNPVKGHSSAVSLVSPPVRVALSTSMVQLGDFCAVPDLSWAKTPGRELQVNAPCSGQGSLPYSCFSRLHSL